MNKLCSDIPTEVAALSSGVDDWTLTTGNSLNTPCGWEPSDDEDSLSTTETSLLSVSGKFILSYGTVSTKCMVCAQLKRSHLCKQATDLCNNKTQQVWWWLVWDLCIT